MIRLAGAAVVGLHGVIHFIGFVVPWRIATVEGFPYRVTALGGLADLGDVGTRVVGLLWLACAVGFIVAGIGIARRASWALQLTAVLAAVSIVLCVLGLPETTAGLVVNMGILVAVAWTKRAGTGSLAVTS
jgi:hypothetical protein